MQQEYANAGASPLLEGGREGSTRRVVRDDVILEEDAVLRRADRVEPGRVVLTGVLEQAHGIAGVRVRSGNSRERSFDEGIVRLGEAQGSEPLRATRDAENANFLIGANAFSSPRERQPQAAGATRSLIITPIPIARSRSTKREVFSCTRVAGLYSWPTSLDGPAWADHGQLLCGPGLVTGSAIAPVTAQLTRRFAPVPSRMFLRGVARQCCGPH